MKTYYNAYVKFSTFVNDQSEMHNMQQWPDYGNSQTRQLNSTTYWSL